MKYFVQTKFEYHLMIWKTNTILMGNQNVGEAEYSLAANATWIAVHKKKRSSPMRV